MTFTEFDSCINTIADLLNSGPWKDIEQANQCIARCRQSAKIPFEENTSVLEWPKLSPLHELIDLSIDLLLKLHRLLIEGCDQITNSSLELDLQYIGLVRTHIEVIVHCGLHALLPTYLSERLVSSKRYDFENKNQFVNNHLTLFKNCFYPPYSKFSKQALDRLLYYYVKRLYICVARPISAISHIFVSRHFIDVFACLMYAVFDINATGQPENETLLSLFEESVDASLLLPSYFYLMSFPNCPWLVRACSTRLSLLLIRPKGIRSVISFLDFDMWRLTLLILSPQTSVELSIYLENVSSQLKYLLDNEKEEKMLDCALRISNSLLAKYPEKMKVFLLDKIENREIIRLLILDFVDHATLFQGPKSDLSDYFSLFNLRNFLFSQDSTSKKILAILLPRLASYQSVFDLLVHDSMDVVLDNCRTLISAVIDEGMDTWLNGIFSYIIHHLSKNAESYAVHVNFLLTIAELRPKIIFGHFKDLQTLKKNDDHRSLFLSLLVCLLSHQESFDVHELRDALKVLDEIETLCSDSSILALAKDMRMKISVELMEFNFKAKIISDKTNNIVHDLTDNTSGKQTMENEKMYFHGVDHHRLSNLMNMLKDPLVPVRGHGLIELKKLLEKRDAVVTSCLEDIWVILMNFVSDDDSFLFLKAIDSLVEVIIIDRKYMVDAINLYADGSRSSVVEQCQVHSLITRLRYGEVLSRVIEYFGKSAIEYDYLPLVERILTVLESNNLRKTNIDGSVNEEVIAYRQSLFTVCGFVFSKKEKFNHPIFFNSLAERLLSLILPILRINEKRSKNQLVQQSCSTFPDQLTEKSAALFVVDALFRNYGEIIMKLPTIQSSLKTIYNLLKEITFESKESVPTEVQIHARNALIALNDTVKQYLKENTVYEQMYLNKSI